MQTQFETTSDALTVPVSQPLIEAMSRNRRYSWLISLCVVPLCWLLLTVFPGLNVPLFNDPFVHLLIACVASFLGVALALLVLHVAHRLQDARAFLVGLGFLSVASILIIHAVSTPHAVMTGRGGATIWSGLLCLVVGSIFFAFSGLEITPALNTRLMRHARLWLALYLAAWLIYAWFFVILLPPASADSLSLNNHSAAVARPGDMGASHRAGMDASQAGHDDDDNTYDAVSLDDTFLGSFSGAPSTSARTILSIIGLGCFAFAIARHYRLYRRSPSAAGLAITCGIVLFAQALITQDIFPQIYIVSFWITHAAECYGFGVISYAALVAYRQGQGQQTLLEGLFLSGTRARLQAEYTQAVDALVEVLARGEQPSPELRHVLHGRLGLTENQVQAFERAAVAVAQERQQRHELERLNATLRQVEEDKNQLMQMVVHDLKNPLTALVGFLDLLRLDELSDSQLTLVESALRSGKNLSGLISDLLDIGRLEEGRLELDRNLVPPRDLLEDCATEMYAWLVQDGKRLRIGIAENLPLLRVDLRLMQRVMLNLISNAVKHTPSGTTITLRAYQDADAGRVLIEVEDNGPGIPAEYLDHIFEKFGRVGGENHSRQNSTGLGLTFCRLAVEAHGGTIGVASQPGQGATFRVTLPAL